MMAGFSAEDEAKVESFYHLLVDDGLAVHGIGYGSAADTVDYFLRNEADRDRALALLPSHIGERTVTAEVHNWELAKGFGLQD